jgi:V/A-type H+-transporting ATPase subunit E
MSIEKITANILKDAKENAQTVIMNAEKTKLDIINNAMNEAEAIKKTALEKAEKEAESLKSRKVSAAELQKRKMMLTAKQEAIKKSFDEALNKLKSMPEDKYVDFLTKEISKIPYNEGLIILNKRDREKIGEKLVKAVNENLKAEKFKLSNETINSNGGFILRSGSVEINSTFETLLDSIRDELTNEVANALFK